MKGRRCGSRWKPMAPTNDGELIDIDHEALQRCIDLTLAETNTNRVEQVQWMLKVDWLEAARFCAYHR